MKIRKRWVHKARRLIGRGSGAAGALEPERSVGFWAIGAGLML